jgi:hypothetical protein
VLPVSSNGASATDAALDQLLRDVVERLAPLDRTPCSPGEREAAEWLAKRLTALDVTSVTLEREPSWGTFPPTSAGLGISGMLAAALALRGRRAAAAPLALATFAGIVDEAQNGPRILRRLVRRRRETVNVIACVGEENARDTLVVLAHHDAPQSGMLFDQTLQQRLHERAPELLERFKSPLPQWWVGLAGPLATIAAALSGRRGFARLALVLGGLGTAIVADIWRNETVQGANDNLSGVAVLAGLAELLRREPLPGVRLMLVSCGAEETLQDGIRAFIARHRSELDRSRTAFVNVDTVGSPHLLMLEGEGPVWMEDYRGPWMRELVAASAERLGIALRRGFRARASTDSVIPSRAGYPIATLVSITDWLMPANYHLPSDVPANLDYASVADATRLVLDVARGLSGALDRALRL